MLDHESTTAALCFFPETPIRASQLLVPNGIWSEPTLSRSSHQRCGEACTTSATGSARYTQADPIDSFGEDPLYQYARDNPLVTSDPAGLKAEVCCRKLDLGHLTFASPFRHCFLWNDGFVYELLRVNGFGHTSKKPGVPQGRCERCSPKKPCDDTGKCLDQALNSYPQDVPYDVSIFSLTGGPNSNTFGKELANKCCSGGLPRDMSSWWNWTPGVTSRPPVPDWRDRIGDPSRW